MYVRMHVHMYESMYVEPYSCKCCATHERAYNILIEDGRDAHYIYIVYHQE
jgi:hypothetical protein